MSLKDLIQANALEAGTKKYPGDFDATLIAYEKELNLLLEKTFNEWYETRVMTDRDFRGIARKRFL